MSFNRQLYLHIFGIFVVVCLISYALFFTNYYASTLTLCLVLIFQIFALQRHIDSTNRLLARFLSAIKYSDFSQSFANKKINTSFTELAGEMDAVIKQFQGAKSDKEIQANYLSALVEQVPLALCSIDKDGNLLLFNHAFKSLFKKSKLRHVSDLNEYGQNFIAFLTDATAAKEETLTVNRESESLQLKITSTIFRSQGKQEKLVSIQNIRSELESKELEAWQKLIRVLTHEIMNSVTPITSLAETADHYIAEASDELKTGQSQQIESLLVDARDALKTIEGRGQGLMRFVESYRSLSKLPTPKMSTFRLSGLFKSLEHLVQARVKSQNVELLISVKPEILELRADPELLEQALINLLNNSLDAVSTIENPRIEVRADMLELGRVQLSIIDNGIGIPPQNLSDVFVPFFTTKRGGSGIGMSIVKQVVKLNGGNIDLVSTENVGTTVRIVF